MADTYEEDRIGQGRIGAPIAGGVANLLTAGNAGDVNVGGPNKAERLLENYQGNQQKANNVTNKKK